MIFPTKFSFFGLKRNFLRQIIFAGDGDEIGAARSTSLIAQKNEVTLDEFEFKFSPVS